MIFYINDLPGRPDDGRGGACREKYLKADLRRVDIRADAARIGSENH